MSTNALIFPLYPLVFLPFITLPVLTCSSPNPFGDGTIIRYFVTEKSATASMIFYDEFGNKIKSVELPHKGQNAELNLSTSNLSSGIYSYSLVVDGKITATKNMVKTK